MLKWLRTRASAVAAAALVSLVAMGLAELRPHVPDCHDPACAATFGSPDDGAGARLSSGVATRSADHETSHCAGCHLSRSFRLHPQAGCVHAPPLDHSARPHFIAAQLPAGPSVAEPSLRSPPQPFLI